MFKKAVELDPSNIDAHYSLATAYEDKEKYDLAIKEYEKVLELKPDDKDTMYSLGILYLIKNEKEKAFELVNKLERLNPGLGKELKILIDKMK
jgi:tetratricopeptide (TPR) repeat protein